MLYQPLDEPLPLRGAIERLLLNALEIFSTLGHPAGCFLVATTATGSEGAAYVREEMKKRRAEQEEAICRRLKRGIAEGELHSSANPAIMVKFFNTVMQGISTQPRDGATPEELCTVAKNAMAICPSNP